MRHKGRVVEWNDERGYGFIAPMVGEGRAFLHIKSFARRHRRPAVGDVVIYELKRDDAGRSQAARVTFSDDRSAPRKARASSGMPLMVGTSFYGLVIVLVVLGKLSPIGLGVYGLLGAVTYAAYAWDKSSARMRRWRTSESTLLLLGLIGGWPAALIAQQLLRHKLSKGSFMSLFWVCSAAFHCNNARDPDSRRFAAEGGGQSINRSLQYRRRALCCVWVQSMASRFLEVKYGG